MTTIDDSSTAADEILTIDEVAAMLKVTTRTIHRYVDRRGLPGHSLGGEKRANWRFIRSEVLDWVRISCSTPIADQHAA